MENKLYAVSFDQISRKESSHTIANALKKLGEYTNPVHNFWIISSEMTTNELTGYLYQYLDKDEKLIVVRLSGEGHFDGVDRETLEWVRHRFISPGL